MPSIESALKILAKGEFVCPVRYEAEYAALDAPAGREQAQQWLATVGYRLARLHDEGAFFMAYARVDSELRSQVRQELTTVRKRLDPFVRFFNVLREAQGSAPDLTAGYPVWVSHVSEAVRNSAALEQKLSDMDWLIDGRAADGGATIKRVERMFKLLEEGGYLVLTDPVGKGYSFTGKVDYLMQLISFVNENTPSLSGEEIDDQVDAQQRLDEGPSTELSQASRTGNEVGDAEHG